MLPLLHLHRWRSQSLAGGLREASHSLSGIRVELGMQGKTGWDETGQCLRFREQNNKMPAPGASPTPILTASPTAGRGGPSWRQELGRVMLAIFKSL